MTMNPLPPQAYTKETLGKAFAWLQTQPQSIREFANSPDVLVSLYLKARLNGDGVLGRPSIQNFKNELKSLAGMMGEFDVMEPTAASEAMVRAAATHAQMDTPPVRSAPASAPAPVHFAPPPPMPTPKAPVADPPEISEKNQSPKTETVDTKSKNMISEIRESFNLSTDSEAHRLLISAGYKALQRISKN